MPEDIRQSYSNHLIELMAPETAMFLITTAYNQNEMPGPPFSINEAVVTTLYSEHFDIHQLQRDTCLVGQCQYFFLMNA